MTLWNWGNSLLCFLGGLELVGCGFLVWFFVIECHQQKERESSWGEAEDFHHS